MTAVDEVLRELVLPEADGLLIVPPLAHLSWPSLAVHQLQACARARGHRVAVLYANQLYARAVGSLVYATLCNARGDWLLGERLFARAAFGKDGLAPEHRAFWKDVDEHNAEARDVARRYLDHLSDVSRADESRPEEPTGTRYSREELVRYADLATALATTLGEAIAAKGYRFVGASTTFDQTAASVAILAAVKRAAPATVTILGGANCDGEMARGIVSLGAPIDHVFSGECEEVFPRFCDDLARGVRPPGTIITGEPCRDLDALPGVDYVDWHAQLARNLPELEGTPLWLSYETSRGCWWGEKHHCTFCGLNGTGMAYRGKSPARVVADLERLLANSPTRLVCMTDNIMPHEYHKTLIPRLARDGPRAHLFYEQKANLTLDQVKALYDAGVQVIQPGIEALSSRLLRLMDKGVLARQNVALLRYARSVGMALKWNLLWGLPGDSIDDYRATLALVPLLTHLVPPNGLAHLNVDRFSPYHDRAREHGITDLEPIEAYRDAFPDGADHGRLAYHFRGRYSSGSRDHRDELDALRLAVERWRALWVCEGNRRPALTVSPAGPDNWVLLDTRGLGTAPCLYLSTPQAVAVLVGGPLSRVAAADWAIRAKLAVALDGWCVPLAVASYDVLSPLEKRWLVDEAPAPLTVLKPMKRR